MTRRRSRGVPRPLRGGWILLLALLLAVLSGQASAQTPSVTQSAPGREKICHLCDEGLAEEATSTPTPAALEVTSGTPVINISALTGGASVAPAAAPAEGCAVEEPCDEPATSTPEGGVVNTGSAQRAVIYFFWGDGCPHCAEAEPFLASLAQRYHGVEIQDFEVWGSEENRELLIRMATKFGFEPSAVPTIFIGDQYWVGYTADPIGKEIEAAVAICLATSCPDAGSGVVTPAGAASPVPSATPMAGIAAGPGAAQQTATSASETLDLPLIGSLDLATQSLALSTALIAFVDGFNPCSLWVLSVLLALTLHTGSRKKVLIIGLVFLTVTSLVYVLFIAGLFTMFTMVSFVGWIQVIVALFALFFATVNIKDYFWYKEGISFTISDEKKPGLYRSMRRVLNAGDSMPALIGATVVMSAGASLVEFSCTAGFPVLWTNLLAAQGVTVLTFVLLLMLYMLIYQIDEIAIFLAAVYSLRASKLEEKHGRILKLVSGMLMLTLAIVMLVNPSLMSRLSTSLLVFGIAFGAALLVLLVHRVILPRWGVIIGTEAGVQRGRTRAGSGKA